MKQLTPEEYEEILKMEVPEFRGPQETLLEGRKRSAGTPIGPITSKHRHPLEILVEGRRYPMTQPDYPNEYLTLIPKTDCTFTFNKSGLKYSLDEGDSWIELSGTTPLIAINQKVMFKGELIPKVNEGIGNFSSTGKFNATGNVLSLIYGDKFNLHNSAPDYAFYQLFIYSEVVNIANLILPEIIGIRACDQMFYSCSYLINVPDFEHCIASAHCYDQMFRYCTSIKDLRNLKINTVADYSCSYMFSGCTALLYAPKKFPAKELYQYCYNGMFNNCNNLLTGTLIEADTFAYNCCRGMFSECIKLNYMPPLTPKTLAELSCYCMFQNCRNLHSIKLGGAELRSNCYQYMLNRCSSLSYIECLSDPNGFAIYGWTIGVNNTGTFVKKTGADWLRGTNGIPTNWNIINV